MFAALASIATFIPIFVPMTNGYAHLGDAVVILSGLLLGPLYGALAAGIGSALADLFMGYAVYVPATFVIKGLVALVMGLLVKHMVHKSKYARISFALSAIIAEIIMPVGYFVYETVLWGIGGAIGSVVGNITQAALGIVISTVLYAVVKKIIRK